MQLIQSSVQPFIVVVEVVVVDVAVVVVVAVVSALQNKASK